MKKFLFMIFILVFVGACVPNTYYDINDPYAYGLRWYDRGDFEKAVKYWDPLVEAEDCDAEYHVGVLYFTGQGKPYDPEKAITLWQKAAKANHPKAQVAMGDIHYQNDDVIFHHCVDCKIEKDLYQAYTWYRLAEKSARYEGEKDYIERVLTEIKKEMSEQQIENGNKAVNESQHSLNDCQPRKWW